MGNSESSLSDHRYYFDNPKIDGLDLSKVKVYIIDDYGSASAAEKFLNNAKILYVDCEGHCFGSSEQELGTVQVATGPRCCFLFHISKYRGSLDFLKDLFESDEVQKVFHDCSGDSAVLYHENRIHLTENCVDDTQVAHKVIESTSCGEPIDNRHGLSLADLYTIYCGKNIPGNKQFDRSTQESPGMNRWIHNSELSEDMVKYAVIDVLALYEIFTQQKKYLKRNRCYRDLVRRQLEKKRSESQCIII